MPVADLLIGTRTTDRKDPGTAGISDRFARSTTMVEERVDSDFGGQMAALVIPVVGDLIEGTTSHGGRLPNHLDVTEQVRVVRRLVMHMLGRLAPLAYRVLVICVPGHHDEARRDRSTTTGDSWAIEAVSRAQDAQVVRRYEHVTFVYPDPDELSVTVEVSGLVVGATHRHLVSYGTNGPGDNPVRPWNRGKLPGCVVTGEEV